MAQKVFFSYPEYDENGRLLGNRQLSFNVLILGNFAGNSRDSFDDLQEITRATFHQIFQEIKPDLDIYVRDHLALQEGIHEKDQPDIKINIPINSLEDMQSSSFIINIEWIRRYVKFLKKLELYVDKVGIGLQSLFSEDEKPFLNRLGVSIETEYPLFLMALAEAYENFNLQINEIIYHPSVQELEFNWFSLYKLIFSFQFSAVSIKILNTTKDMLIEDLLLNSDIYESELFSHIYIKELDQYGGSPINMILNTFSATQGDAELFSVLADLARQSSCPIISGIKADFFNIENISYLSGNFDFDSLKQAKNFMPWSKLLVSQDSRFLGFVLPDVKMRGPYQSNWIELASLAFEDCPPDKKRLPGLWGSPVFLFVIPFLRAYDTYQNCFAVEEEEFSKIEGNSVLNVGTSFLEWVASPITRKFLSDHGFMTFSYHQNEGTLSLPDLNMFRVLETRSDINASIEERVNVRLPQILFIAQLSHYLRMIKRQSVAKSNLNELRSELLNWLNRYVSDMGQVFDAQAYLQRPLKEVDIKLSETKTKIGNIVDFQLSIKPHVRYRGLEYSLTL